MKIALDCLPCFVNQVLSTSRVLSLDDSTTRKTMVRVLETLSHFEEYGGTTLMAQHIQRILREETGSSDLFAEAKDKANRWMTQILSERFPEGKAENFQEALQLAVAGNIIDLGAHPELSAEKVLETIANVADAGFAIDRSELLQHALSKADKILYIGDNAGEIVFDKLLISHLPKGKVTFAVRGAPVLNDITRKDARTVGMEMVARIVDTGVDLPGVLLEQSSKEFRQAWAEADLVLAKGQGNFESLCEDDVDRPVFFLFMAKCNKVAQMIGCNVGDYIVSCNKRALEAFKD